jgi:putative membrane protein
VHAFLISWLVTIAALYLVAAIVKEVKVKEFTGAALGAFVLGLVNLVLPMLFHWFGVPYYTIDIVRFLIFAIIFWVAGTFTPGFRVEGAAGAIVGAMILLLVYWALSYFMHMHAPWWARP